VFATQTEALIVFWCHLNSSDKEACHLRRGSSAAGTLSV